MKKLLLSFVAIATFALSSLGQAPEGFKYQAVVRDAGSIILNNQAVGLRMTIQQGSIGGTTVYSETFSTTTNAYGLVNLEIGSGTIISGVFATIDWSNGPYFMETAVDITGGTSYIVMGTSQLLSVPYALYAKFAGSALTDNVDDADNDPTNELQAISFSNDTLYLSNGGQVYLGDYAVDLVDDADADPTNELQAVSFSNDTLYLSNGGQVYLGNYGIDLVDDADNNPTNELQTISRTGTTVTLSNGGGTFQDSVGVYTAGDGIDVTNNVISTTNSGFNVQSYQTPGTYTFTIPAGVTKIIVEVWGGGGGGGSGGTTCCAEDEGGGGGGYAKGVYSVVPGTNYTVTVGAGGAGGVAGCVAATGAGTDGGTSSFGLLISATGGGGGGSINIGGTGFSSFLAISGECGAPWNTDGKGGDSGLYGKGGYNGGGGDNGTAPGGGGCGTWCSGGDGGAGMVIVWW